MKHLIIDGNNIANVAFWRARSVLGEENKDKTPEEQKEVFKTHLSNFGVNVFLNIFHMYLKDNSGYKIYLAWDSRSGANWRKDHTEDYKANRDHSSDEFHPILYDMMDSLKKLFGYYPIYQFEVEHAEADDIIFSLCNILDGQKKIISSDGDMLQIPQKISDVKVWHPMQKKYREVPEYDVVLYKSICGDPSDGIQGLYKYGPKKTLKVLGEGLQTLTAEQRDTVERNKTIVDLSLNPSFEKNTEATKQMLAAQSISNYDFAAIQKLFMTYKQKQHFANADQIKKLLDKTNSDRL